MLGGVAEVGIDKFSAAGVDPSVDAERGMPSNLSTLSRKANVS